MSTLKELNALEGEASAADRKAGGARYTQERIAAIRKGEKPLMVVYKEMGHYNEELRSLIEGVINEHGTDLLRLIEMRQEAFARKCSIEARQKRAALAAAVDPEPTQEGGAS